MLKCLKLNSWICHKRMTSKTLAKDFHLTRTKVRRSKTIRQRIRYLLCWFVSNSDAFSGRGICEDCLAGDDALYAVCPSIDDNPEVSGTMDQKDSNVRDEAQRKRQKNNGRVSHHS